MLCGGDAGCRNCGNLLTRLLVPRKYLRRGFMCSFCMDATIAHETTALGCNVSVLYISTRAARYLLFSSRLLNETVLSSLIESILPTDCGAYLHIRRLFLYLFTHFAKCCDEYACLSVRRHNSKTTRPNFTNFFMHFARGRHRRIKYSLDNLRPIRTAEAFEAVDWLHQQTWLHCRIA